jgi:transcriptional regulator with XRE-family HTH domain
MAECSYSIDIARVIRQARLKQNLTKRQLAFRSGNSHDTIIRIESGENTSISTLLPVLYVLGLKLIIEKTDPEMDNVKRSEDS